MYNQAHLDKLNEGVDAWNQWRKSNPELIPELRRANLSGIHLAGADFSKAQMLGVNFAGADLTSANFSDAVLSSHWEKGIFRDADLSGADLSRANIYEANFIGANLSNIIAPEANLGWNDFTNANLSGAQLQDANLGGSNFHGTNLSGADLSEAFLDSARFASANLDGTNLSDCKVYGTSAWDVHITDQTIQNNLTITKTPLPVRWYPDEKGKVAENMLMVNDLEVAQFIYLIMRNAKIRNVIDASTSKIILILGRFSSERYFILNEIRNELQKHGYLPVIFDFTPSANRDLTETVKLLANLSKGVIADLTDPKSIPQELTSIIPNLPSVPVKPIMLKDFYNSGDEVREYAMFEHWWRYPWVLDLFKYENDQHLRENLKNHILGPLENFIHRKNLASELKVITRNMYSEVDEERIYRAKNLIQNLKDEFGST